MFRDPNQGEVDAPNIVKNAIISASATWNRKGTAKTVRPLRGRAVMSDKIHLERKAILYVRQSSAHQVLHNRESSALQYAMRGRLEQLGWSRIETIDEDLGRSAAGNVERTGFDRMVAEVLAIWLGKILWLLCRKGHASQDYRTRDDLVSNRIVPQVLMPGLTYLGMIERAYAMRKNMYSCYLTDPPLPEFFYGRPYSLYVVEIDTRDARFTMPRTRPTGCVRLF